jgi:predicted permease
VFSALRVRPLRGRLFTVADDQPAAAPVVVISERLWTRNYGSDPGILNRRVEIDRVPHDVIGIVAGHVRFPSPDTELWLPLRLDPAKTESATFDYHAVARLRDDVSVDAAAADLQALLVRLPDEFPGRMTRASIEQTRMRAIVRPLHEVVIGDAARLLWVLFGAAGFVLAIACANVANLLLVRSETRHDAAAIKRALGAARGAIVRESLAEGAVVAGLGGVLAVAGAAAALRLMRSFGDVVTIPRVEELSLAPAVLGVATLGTVCAALCVSAMPALRAMAASASTIAFASGRASTTSRQHHRIRYALLTSQVALALILLVGSGLMARSVWRLRAVQPGFDPTNAISFRIALPSAAYPGAADSVRFFMRAEERLAALPGVTAVGAVSKLPLDEQGRTDTAVFVEDRPIPPGALPGIHPLSYVTPGYFEAAGIPFIAGGGLTRPDPPRVALEAVVSRAFAERYWKSESAIGRRIRIFSRGPWYTVVGVVGSVRDTALDREEDQTIYCPLLPAREDPRWAPRDVAVVVRTAGDPAGAAGTIRGVIRDLDPSLPVYRVRPLADIVAAAFGRRTFALFLIAGASGLALLLGAVGLYGVMAYVVTLRTREMGIRLALGAQPAQIRAMVSRQGIGVALLGIAIGLTGVAALTRLLSTLLFEVSATDPAVVMLAAALLVLVAAAASWLPARRAAAVDPSVTLRLH